MDVGDIDVRGGPRSRPPDCHGTRAGRCDDDREAGGSTQLRTHVVRGPGTRTREEDIAVDGEVAAGGDARTVAVDIHAGRGGVAHGDAIDGDVARRARVDDDALEGGDTDREVSDVLRAPTPPDDIAAAGEHADVGIVTDAAVIGTDHQASRHARVIQRIAGRDERALGGSRHRTTAAEDDHAPAGGMRRGRTVRGGAGVERRAVADQDAAVTGRRGTGVGPIDDVSAVGLDGPRGVLQDVRDGLEDDGLVGGRARDVGGDRDVAAEDPDGTGDADRRPDRDGRGVA